MPRHTDRKPGWQNRKIKAQEKKQREQAAAKRGQAMTVGKGGITIKDGGKLVSSYPASDGGGEATRFGPLTQGDDLRGYVFQLKDENGKSIFAALRNLPTTAYPTPISAVYVEAEQQVFNSPTGSGFAVYSEQTQLVGEQVRIWGTVGGVCIGHATTGASANTFIDPSDGRIWRSTSSQRYKQDITDLTVDPEAVLRMRPRMWRDKAQVEADPETDTHYVGFIAEELHDLGLTAFVVYDDEDKPEAIAYDRLSAALVGLAQQQQREHDALKANVASLSQRLAALESR